MEKETEQTDQKYWEPRFMEKKNQSCLKLSCNMIKLYDVWIRLQLFTASTAVLERYQSRAELCIVILSNVFK